MTQLFDHNAPISIEDLERHLYVTNSPLYPYFLKALELMEEDQANNEDNVRDLVYDEAYAEGFDAGRAELADKIDEILMTMRCEPDVLADALDLLDTVRSELEDLSVY